MARIKGQEVSLQLTQDGTVLNAFSDIQSCEVEGQFEILSEGYLGEGSNRKDEVFMGVSGSLECHFGTKDALLFMRDLMDRATRRTAGTAVNLRTSLRFPDGDRLKIILPDLAFGAFPISFGGRSEYVRVTLNFEGSSVQFV